MKTHLKVNFLNLFFNFNNEKKICLSQTKTCCVNLITVYYHIFEKIALIGSV